jgi:death-on-curing protein
MSGDIFMLDPADIRALHEDIVTESDVTSAGIRSPGAIESAITYVTVGYFGEAPSTIYETATHLMRLLVAEHPFVDGNKRTGLNAAAVLYDLNGYDFAYDDEEVRSMLKAFGTDLNAVDVPECVGQCRNWATAADDTTSDDASSGDTPEESAVTGETDRTNASNRGQLRERARSAEKENRREAIRRLGMLERERNAVTYERLARE